MVRCEVAQEKTPVPAPLHLHRLAGPGPGEDRRGVAGADTVELCQGPGCGRHPGGTPGDSPGGGEEDTVGLDHWPASVVHQALVQPRVSRPHLQHLQDHGARHQADCEESFMENKECLRQ